MVSFLQIRIDSLCLLRFDVHSNQPPRLTQARPTGPPIPRLLTVKRRRFSLPGTNQSHATSISETQRIDPVSSYLAFHHLLHFLVQVILTFVVIKMMILFEVETFHMLYGHLHMDVSGPGIVSSLHHFATKDCAPRCGFHITHTALKPKPIPCFCWYSYNTTHYKQIKPRECPKQRQSLQGRYFTIKSLPLCNHPSFVHYPNTLTYAHTLFLLSSHFD